MSRPGLGMPKVQGQTLMPARPRQKVVEGPVLMEKPKTAITMRPRSRSKKDVALPVLATNVVGKR